MQKAWTEEEVALRGTQPDRTLAARTHGNAEVYLSRDEGLEPLSDEELVRVSRQLGVEGAVVHAVRLQHEQGLPLEEAARIAGVHAETVGAWVRAGAVRI